MLGASGANACGLPSVSCLELFPARCFIGHAQKQFSQTNFDLCSYPPPPLGNRPLKGQIRQRLQGVKVAPTWLARSRHSIRGQTTRQRLQQKNAGKSHQHLQQLTNIVPLIFLQTAGAVA